jgi:hypothetical protein
LAAVQAVAMVFQAQQQLPVAVAVAVVAVVSQQ